MLREIFEHAGTDEPQLNTPLGDGREHFLHGIINQNVWVEKLLFVCAAVGNR